MTITDIPIFLAQTTEYQELSDAEAAGLIGVLVAAFLAMMVPLLILMAIYIISMWKIFTKAGQPGWAAIVPVYGAIVLIQVAGRPVWWFVLLCIPFVNIVIGIILAIDLAKAFGKGGGFAAGLLLLGPIFYPILAFGSARYQGAPTAIVAPPAAPPADPPPGPPAEGA